ncbi:MAG: glycosyltransferase [Acetobacteraceae bacterium]|nr:glycosyltransferase [Acetobacteraceae bacterium]
MAAIAPRPDPEPPRPDAAAPVTVAGYFGAPTGLGAAARRLAAALRLAGFVVAEADLTGPLRQGPPGPPPRVAPGPGTLMVHVNGPLLPWAMRVLGRGAVAGKRVVAVWNWELPALAPDWRRGFRFAHEVWVSSRFTAGAVEAEPGAPPVRVVPYMVPEPDPSPLRRADFGLPEDAFVALSVFDASSSIARKNPLAAIAAHRAAFGDRPDRALVLKTHNTDIAGPAWREVAEAAAGTPNVFVLDRALGRRDLWALVIAADCFLSTHRSEGFGFGIAEAMRAARPVLATGWSGNMDFMGGAGAVALPYDLVPARDPQRTYDLPGAVWAEARVADAAAALAALAEAGPERRAALGAAAREAAEALSPAAVAARARAALLGLSDPGAQGPLGLQGAGISV